MISPELWKTIAECLQDILLALEKNARIGDNDEVVQINCEDWNSSDCDVD
ncbi:MAG: hypothetical protein ACLTXM_02090 [Enterococcus sp.]